MLHYQVLNLVWDIIGGMILDESITIPYERILKIDFDR